MDEPFVLSRRVFETQRLVDSFPPRWKDRNKKAVARISCPPGCAHAGQVVFSRWGEMPLPESVEPIPTDFECREDVFGYEPAPPGGTVEWYLNFAHHDVFAFYGGPLFAQDEMQVVEHPALASLREALVADPEIRPLTVEAGRPTPVLVRGVERRCAVATSPDPAQGRPFGLYGNHFADVKPAVVELATRPILPPTVSNILAIEAPAYGSGAYSIDQIRFIVRTAFTGFAAARLESRTITEGPEVVLRTGFWGCGAYGGNRVLMALLQLLAAKLARADRLVFHALNPAGSAAFASARELFDREARPGPLADVLAKIEALRFQWGTSDGN